MTEYYEDEEEKKPTLQERTADLVAKFGGSWAFIISFFIFIGVWIGVNLYARLDTYPYILLNLILSCVAALQAPIIMMSQNRQEQKDRKRAKHGYYITIELKKEIDKLQRKMNVLIKELEETQEELRDED